MKSVAFACAVLVSAAPGLAAGPKWVPLDSHAAKVMQGQTAAPAPASAPPEAPQAPRPVRFLPAGTLVSLSPLQEISSKHMFEGQRFDFMVVEDVAENGAVVIPRGSRATGVVTAQTGRAIGGKSGKFDISFESVTANNVRFPLTGITRREGNGNTMGALFGLIFISGRSATLLPGQVVTAMTSAQTAY
jgi:hypothetical protein